MQNILINVEILFSLIPLQYHSQLGKYINTIHIGYILIDEVFSPIVKLLPPRIVYFYRDRPLFQMFSGTEIATIGWLVRFSWQFGVRVQIMKIDFNTKYYTWCLVRQ